MDDFSFTAENAGMLKNISTMGAKLKELQLKMLKAETAYTEAKKEYEYYSSTVLPTEMFNAGVTARSFTSESPP